MSYEKGDIVWVKTTVMYQDTYEGDKYPVLGLESVTVWDLNNEENRDNITKEDK